MNTRGQLSAFVTLMRAYSQGRIESKEFETIYLRLFMNDVDTWDQATYDQIAAVFHAVDDYWPGETEPETALADQTLLAEVNRALTQLESMP